MGTPHSASHQPLEVAFAAPRRTPAEALSENPPSNMQGVINRLIDEMVHEVTPSNETLGCTHAADASNALNGSEVVALASTWTSLAPKTVAEKEIMIPYITVADLNNLNYLRQFMTESDTVKADDPEQDTDVQIVTVTHSTKVPNERDEKSIFTCLQCPYACSVENQMILHMFEHYDFTVLCALSQSTDFNYKAGQYSCVSCAFETPSRLMFREHVRCHVNIKPYSCVECGAFVSLKNIRSHYKSSHERSIPAIRVAPSEILDTLMQRLGPAAPHLITNVKVGVKDAPLDVCKPIHVPNQPDSTLAHDLQSTSESCQTKMTHANLQFQQKLDVSFCEKEAGKNVPSPTRNTDLPPVSYNVNSSAGNAEYLPARMQPRSDSDDVESGVHDMDLEMGNGENATPQVSTTTSHDMSTSSHDMPVSKSYIEVKPPEDCRPDKEKYQQATGKPTERSEKESAIEEPTGPNQPEQKPVQVIIVKQYQKPPIKKPPVKKQTLKLLVDFENGMFTCKSCNVKERDEALFRKHIWQDIHLSGVCTHSGSANSADGCTILDNLMHLLLPKRHANDMPVSKKHSSTAAKAAGVPAKAASQTEAKQKTAQRNRTRVRQNMARLEKNVARVKRNNARTERKDTRAAARAAKSKLDRTQKMTKCDSDDEDDEEFSPDDSNDEDWCNEQYESSMSEEEDDKSAYSQSEHITTEESAESSDSDTANSGAEELTRKKIQQSLKSATSEPQHGNECLPTPNTGQHSDSVNSEHRGETVNPTTSDFDSSLEPITSEPSDKNNSMVTPELQGSSHPATSESDQETDTYEPNDQMKRIATPEVRESPEHFTSEQNDVIEDGPNKPQYEESSNSNDKEKSSATSELQGTPECDSSKKDITEKEQCDEKSDSTNPPYDQNDKKESSANTELNGTSEFATSVVRDKNHEPTVPGTSEKDVAEPTSINKGSKGENRSLCSKTGDGENIEVESSSISDDVIVLSEENDESVKQSSTSTSSDELGSKSKATSRRCSPRKSSLKEGAMMKSNLTQTKIVPKGTITEKSADDKKMREKTTDKPTKNADKRASPQTKKDGETVGNDKPGMDAGDNDTDEEDEEEGGNFFKCKLPLCGRSYADVASLKAHIKKCHSVMTLFPCPYCSCLWSDYNRLVEHIPAHSGPTPYRCVQCDVCFAKSSQLKKHIKKSHHVNKKFTCTLSGCTFVSNLWTEFKVHNLSYHVSEKAFTCFACDARFKNLNDYFLHIESGMETLICCSQCTMKAKMRHTILRHSASVHPGLSKGVFVQTTVKCAEPNEPPQPNVVLTKRIVVAPTKKIILHECSNCDFADENKASFDKHVKSHELSENLQLAFSCPYCPFGSSELPQYRMHIANHRSKSTHQLRCFKCTHCPFVTNEMMMIEKHLQEKHKERPFKFQVQQEVVTAKMKRTGAIPGVEQSGSNATRPSVSGKMQKSVKSTETSSSSNALKKDVVVKRKTPVTEIKRGKVKRRRRSKRISSDDDDDDSDTYSPMEKIKHVATPELTSQATDRSVSLRRSCRISKAPKPTENISSISSDDAEAACDVDDEDPIVPPSKPDNDNIGRQPGTRQAAPVEKAPTTAPSAVREDGEVQIDRFHCDSCEFACADWNVMHDHVQSLHENKTQWSNVSMSVTSTVTTMTAAGERVSTPDDKTTTANDNEAADADSGSVHDRQRYSCNLCNICCQEWNTFKTHMADAHSYDVIKPDDANSNIMAVPIERPRAPMQVHRSGQFHCQSCTFSTDSKTNMWRHKKGHSTKLKAGYKCMYCSYSSPQKFVITRHVQNYHSDKPSDQTHVVVLQSRKMPTICLKANDRRPTTEHRVVGVDRQSNGSYDVAQPEPQHSGALLEDREFHSDNDDLDDEDIGVGQTNADCSSYCSRVDSHDLFQCNLCEFMHRFPSKVLRHFNYRHTKHCPYQCGYCDFRSVESGKVKRHCGAAHRWQAPKVIKVDVDAKTSEPVGVLMSGSNKNEDVETEGSDEDEDKQDGDNQWWWRRHVKTSENQMVSCNLCGYRQVGTSALKRHILAIHLGFTPFACKYCDFSTMEIRKVREHIRKTHPDLACKVIRRKYQGDPERSAGSSTHVVKVGHTSGEAGQPDNSLPSISVRTRTGVPAAKERAVDNPSFTDAPVSQTAESTDLYPVIRTTSAIPPVLASMLLNVKPEPNRMLDTDHRPPPQHIKFYKCIYCNFCSEESLHDIRDHIFISHLRRDHFMCPHCQFGSMKRDDVISHCLENHPDDNQKVDEDRTHTRNISILETHGDVLLVGMLTDTKVPMIELPGNPQEAAPRPSATSVTEAPGVDLQNAHATIPSSNRTKPTARKRTSAVSRKSNQKKTGKLKTAVTKKNRKGDTVIHTCKACDFFSHRLDTVEKHILCVHLHKSMYSCPYCKKNFPRNNLVKGHITAFHPGKKVLVECSMKRNRAVIRSFIIKKVTDGAGVTATEPSVVPESQAPNRKKRRTGVLGDPTKTRTETRTREPVTVVDESDVEDGKCGDGDGTLTKLRSPTAIEGASALVFVWKCTTCGTKLAMLEAMRHHVLTEHMDLQPYQCAVCVFGERTSVLVEAHIRDKHRHSRIHIPVVDVVAEKREILKEKMIRVKTKKAPSSAATASGSSEKFDYSTLYTIGRLGEPVYRCDLCDHEVRSKSSMMSHRQSHSKFRRFGCTYCAYKTSKIIFMGSHIINVHVGRPMKYRDYGNSDAGSGDQNHRGLTETNCQTTGLNRSGQSVIGKKAPRKSTEVEKNARVTDYFHAAVKTPDVGKVSGSREKVTPSSDDTDDDQRPMFECLMCGKTMQLARSIRYHIMNDHLKYRPYKCSHCKTRNANRRGIREHIAKHHAGKPCVINYKCNKNMDAIVEANVKRVTSTGNADKTNKPAESNAGTKKPRPSNSHAHTDGMSTSPESEDLPAESYLCVLCKTYTATWKHGMLRHIAEEIHYSPFVCPYCSFSANRQDTVRNHVKSEHPDLEVSVKFDKDEAKEQRALELLEKSVVLRDTHVMGTQIERNREDSPGRSNGCNRKLSTRELGTVSPVRMKTRRPGPRTPGRATYWLGDEFQPSVTLIDVMRMPSWELKRLLQRLRFTNVSILF